MLYKKYVILFFLFSLSILTAYSQDCDCNIFPVKKECKQKCGFKDLQTGSEEELVKKLGIKKETAQKIVKVSTRKNYKKLSDFEEDLPIKYYQDLEKQFNAYLEGNVIQNNQNGDNVNGNKVVGTQIVGNPQFTINTFTIDSIKIVTARDNKVKREIISRFYRQGNLISEKLKTDSLDKEFKSELNGWYWNVIIYLNEIDVSYATQFEIPSSQFSFSYNIPRKENEDQYRGVLIRNKVLYDIMTSLR
jgi:hypothetical protein